MQNNLKSHQMLANSSHAVKFYWKPNIQPYEQSMHEGHKVDTKGIAECYINYNIVFYQATKDIWIIDGIISLYL